jgi:phosphate uptake regulator
MPVEWVRDNNLKEGSEVRMEEQDGELRLSTDRKPAKTLSEIEITETDEDSIRYLLYISYRNGVSRLKIISKDKKALDSIENIAFKHFMGFQVTEKAKDHVIIEVITEPVLERFDSLLRKLFLITEESMALMNESIKAGKFDRLTEMNTLTDRYRQIDNFCRRHISLVKKNDVNVGNYQSLFTHLMMIQTDMRWLYEWCSKNKPKKTGADFERFADNFYQCTKAFFKSDKDTLSKLNSSIRKNLYGDAFKAMTKAKNNQVVLHYIAQDTRILYSTLVPMISIILNKD